LRPRDLFWTVTPLALRLARGPIAGRPFGNQPRFREEPLPTPRAGLGAFSHPPKVRDDFPSRRIWGSSGVWAGSSFLLPASRRKVVRRANTESGSCRPRSTLATTGMRGRSYAVHHMIGCPTLKRKITVAPIENYLEGARGNLTHIIKVIQLLCKSDGLRL